MYFLVISCLKVLWVPTVPLHSWGKLCWWSNSVEHHVDSQGSCRGISVRFCPELRCLCKIWEGRQNVCTRCFYTVLVFFIVIGMQIVWKEDIRRYFVGEVENDDIFYASIEVRGHAADLSGVGWGNVLLQRPYERLDCLMDPFGHRMAEKREKRSTWVNTALIIAEVLSLVHSWEGILGVYGGVWKRKWKSDLDYYCNVGRCWMLQVVYF